MDFYTLSTRPRRADGVFQLGVLASWKSVAHRYTALLDLTIVCAPRSSAALSYRLLVLASVELRINTHMTVCCRNSPRGLFMSELVEVR